jgi:arginase family enzyme
VDVGLIRVPWDWSVSGRPGSRFAPSSVRSQLNSLSLYSNSSGIDLSKLSWVDYGNVKIAAGERKKSFGRITKVAYYFSRHVKLTILLGGDHSITYPSLEGLVGGEDESVGLLVFDAHYDLRRTKEGVTSGSYLRQCYESESISKKLKTAIIGIRDYANPPYLQDYAVKFGIKTYTFEDVRKKGIISVVKEAVRFLRSYCSKTYMSIDLDVMDCKNSPGVNSPGVPGLDSAEILSGVKTASSLLKPIISDLVEIVPWADHNSGTSLLASLIAFNIVEGRFGWKLAARERGEHILKSQRNKSV